MIRDRLGEVNILSKFQLSSSYGLGVTVHWRYFHKGSVTDLIINKGVCRTAPATLGLLNMSYYRLLTLADKKWIGKYRPTGCLLRRLDLEPKYKLAFLDLPFFLTHQVWEQTKEAKTWEEDSFTPELKMLPHLQIKINKCWGLYRRKTITQVLPQTIICFFFFQNESTLVTGPHLQVLNSDVATVSWFECTPAHTTGKLSSRRRASCVALKHTFMYLSQATNITGIIGIFGILALVAFLVRT